ncbi:hemerythrin domain-containing protein [Paenibacillus mendelii]|uniref:Hemerythrin domain-containing protein n=1 Tax=Paenibacillus mendelii TaxID=206163 RepID=A0ABV6J5Z6_9BACL|nr:hemerythrin domain-containing protein [Paenibacillus mendelii]MCQ6560015.1 hemerythrin domain-containing protein [Paenibacillus mendelii]
MMRMEAELEPLDSARTSAFLMLVIQLKTDHDCLKEKVDALYERSMSAAASPMSSTMFQTLEQLRSESAHLVSELDRHAKWEDQELFPIITSYFKKKIEPTMMPSIWVLEKDHELALQFFDTFLELSGSMLSMLKRGMERYDVHMAQQLKQATDHLTQGCLILKGHFHMEEDVLFPLVGEILTDIDYLFS